MSENLLDFDHVAISKLKGESRIKKFKVSKKDVAIIGIYARMPLAQDINEFWKCLREGRDCIGTFPESRRKDVEAYLKYKGMYKEGDNYPLAGYLKDIDKFDHNFFQISPKEASLMDPTQRLFLEAAWGVIEDAGYGGNKITGSRTGVYVGFKSALSDQYQRMIYDLDPSLLELSVTGNKPAIVASRIAYILDLRGPAMLVDTTCSSSLVALHLACQGIRNSECDMAIVGGIKLNLLPVGGGQKLGIESSDGRTKAFDDSSDGTGIGEGVGAVLLKPLDKALEDRDNIYAVIKGSAINQDGRSNGIAAPNPVAQEDVILRAWKDAGIDPDTISYIEAHGTGTKLGDPIEIDGLQRAFRRYTQRKRFCGIGSVKSNIGHLDNAAGIAGLLKAILALKHGEIPPSLHFSHPNRNINFDDSPFYVNNILRKWEKTEFPRRCGLSAFGLSGTNCHVVLEEAPCNVDDTGVSYSDCNLLTLSAKSEISMMQLLHKLRMFVESEKRCNLRDVCYTASTGRGHYSYRIAIIFKSRDELLDKMNNLCIKKSETSSGVYYSKHKIVSENKDCRESCEITELEQARLNKDVADILKGLKLNEYRIEESLDAICSLYVKGADIEWEELYKNEKRKRLNLPIYPFEQKRCWVDIKHPEKLKMYEDNLFYNIKWESSELENVNNIDKLRNTLVFKSKNGISDEIVKRLKDNRNIIEISLGSKYEKRSENSYTISGCAADYKTLITDIGVENINQIIHLFAVDVKEDVCSVDILEENQKLGVYSLLYIAKAVLDLGIQGNINIMLIARQVNCVSGVEKRIFPENAVFFGLGKVIEQEDKRLKCTCIDIDGFVDFNSLCKEVQYGSNQVMVAYREGKRYIETIEKLDISSIPETNYQLREDGVYVITGGTDGIGLEIAKYLSSRGRVNLALINRTVLPAKSEWDSIIKAGKCDEKYNRIRTLYEIEQNGSKVMCYRADITKIDEISTVINELRISYGRINGIIHSAGMAGDGFLVNKEEEEFKKVLAPKVRGTWILESLMQEDEVDFFIMCSSFTSFRGAPGQGDYTAANSYLDSFAAYGEIKGKRMLTINWPAWKETGMALKFGVNVDGVFKAITTEKAIQAFDQVIRRNVSRVIIGELNHESDIVKNLPTSIKVSDVIKKEIELRKVKDAIPPVKAEELVCSNKIKVMGRKLEDYTETEKNLSVVWGEVLGIEEINIGDDLYEIGGDSIIAMKIANILNKQLGLKVESTEILKYSTIRELAGILDEKLMRSKPKNNIPLIKRTDDMEYYPLTRAQRRLFILNKIEGSSVNYNMPKVVRIEGKLDKVKVNEVLNALVNHHESLRTYFEVIEGEPVQKILEDVEFEVGYVESQEDRINDIVETFIKPYMLESAPLFRVQLVKTGEDVHYLLFDMHHIISDGTSIDIFISQFISLYKGESLPEQHIRYRDYCIWHDKLMKSDVIKKEEGYWLEMFSGDIPVLNMPIDYPRPLVQSFEGDRVFFKTDNSLMEGLKNIAIKSGTTLYMVLLAAYNILLSRYTGQEDLIVGYPISSRNNVELENVVGLFANTLVFRCYPKSDKTFYGFLGEVKQNALKSYENQNYQFEELIENLNIKRDISRNPLFDAMFIFKNGLIMEKEIQGLKFILQEFAFKTSKFDITLSAMEKKTEIDFVFEYCTRLFKRETVERIMRHFINILNVLVKYPDIRLSEIDLLSDWERQQILHSFNNTATPYDKHKTIQKLFEEQVKITPDNIAVIFKGDKLTYKEINEKSNQLARKLGEKGVKPGSIVGIMVKRSTNMIIGILGVLKAGAAYLPIDLQYPYERIKFILEDSRVSTLLTETLQEKDMSFNTEVVKLDENVYTGDTSNLNIINTSQDLAYIIYTSGSTGKPKGVMIEHKAVNNFITGITNKIDFSQGKTILALTTISFDIFILETILPLAKGLKVVIADENEQRNMKLLSNIIQKHGIMMLQLTPSRMQMLLSDTKNSNCLQDVKEIMLGGEALSDTLLKNVKTVTSAKIYNMYGPTETTVWSSVQDLTDKESIDIGRPIANTYMYIIDKNIRLQPIGVVGELCIAGDGVTRGYLNREELQAEKFIPNPFIQKGIMYRTGDLARWMPDGSIEFIGRLDHQVKIRGYRIELGEIEYHLLNIEGVRKAIVLDRDDGNENKHICAYIVSDEPLKVSEIRNNLLSKLPDYMMPSYFMQLNDIPLTPNGKVDRTAFPRPESIMEEKENEDPKDELEKKLLKIWEDVLGIEKIGIEDDFFNIGGQSLLAIKLEVEMNKNNIPVEYNDIYKNSSIKKLAQEIRNKMNSK